MSAEQDYKKKFIETIRRDVFRLNEYRATHINIPEKVIEYIESCMNFLYEVHRVSNGWAGVSEQYRPKEMDDDVAINVIRNNILPTLKSAASCKEFIDTELYNQITALVEVVKTFFGISSGDDDVNELNTRETTGLDGIVSELNSRVTSLEETVQELRAEVRTLKSERSPATNESNLLLKKLARLT